MIYNDYNRQIPPIANKLLCLLLFVIMWLLSGWNTDNSDYINYVTRYDVIAQRDFDWRTLDFGYFLVQQPFIRMSLDFAQYRILLYGIALLAIYYVCKRWCHYVLVALLFYFLLHFLRDVGAVRNFLSSVIILLSYEFVGRKELNNKMFFLLLVFFAFSIHMSFILYFLLVFSATNRNLPYWKFFTIALLLSVVAIPIMQITSNILEFDGLDAKVERYSEESHIGALIKAAVLAFFNGYVINKFSVYGYSLKDYNINGLTFPQYTQIINNINCILCVLVVFSTSNFSFYSRLFSNVLLMNVIFLLNIYKLYPANKSQNVFFIIIYMIVYITQLQIIPFDLHLDYLLHNNSFFGWE